MEKKLSSFNSETEYFNIEHIDSVSHLHDTRFESLGYCTTLHSKTTPLVRVVFEPGQSAE